MRVFSKHPPKNASLDQVDRIDGPVRGHHRAKGPGALGRGRARRLSIRRSEELRAG